MLVLPAARYTRWQHTLMMMQGDVRQRGSGAESISRTAGVHVGEQPGGDVQRRWGGALARLHQLDVGAYESLPGEACRLRCIRPLLSTALSAKARVPVSSMVMEQCGRFQHIVHGLSRREFGSIIAGDE